MVSRGYRDEDDLLDEGGEFTDEYDEEYRGEDELEDDEYDSDE
jgi:hypothetical protein